MVAVAAVLMYSPATQSVRAAQTLSFVAVGAVLSYSVPLQVVTAVQLAALIVVEKSIPDVHGAHTWLVLSVAGTLMYSPGSQSV